MVNSKNNKIKKNTVPFIVVFILFAIYAVIILSMYIWATVQSGNTHVNFITDSIGFPKPWRASNYKDAFSILSANRNSYFDMVINSMCLTIGRSVIDVGTKACVGYVLGRYAFTGKKWYIRIFIITMMIPVYGSDPAKIIMLKKVGFYDSPMFIFNSIGVHGSMTLIMMTYFEGLSPAFGEAAEMDGATKLDIFAKVYLPMAIPMVVSVFVITVLAAWNDYTTPIYYLRSYPNIASGLYMYEKYSKYNMNKPVYFAGVVMCAIPPLLLFVVARDKIMTSLTYGGVKE